jgi:hypothetical protein
VASRTNIEEPVYRGLHVIMLVLLFDKEMLRASPEMCIPYSKNWPIERSLVVICGMCNTCSRCVLMVLPFTLCFKSTAPSPLT